MYTDDMYILYKEHSLRVKFEAPNFAFSVQIWVFLMLIYFIKDRIKL
jgi:hypothetical protein